MRAAIDGRGSRACLAERQVGRGRRRMETRTFRARWETGRGRLETMVDTGPAMNPAAARWIDLISVITSQLLLL